MYTTYDTKKTKARGIDVPQVSLVINYDMPANKEQYVHRVGRSARFGRKGVAISFVTQKSNDVTNLIEKCYQIKLDDIPQDVADVMP